MIDMIYVGLLGWFNDYVGYGYVGYDLLCLDT